MHTEEETQKWAAKGNPRFGHSKGYVRLNCPAHPNADAKGWVYEHTLIASNALRRGLRRGETVHHINGRPADNRPNNLLVCTHQYHRALHSRLHLSDAWPQFTRPPNKRPACRRCGAAIGYNSRSGLCLAHYWDNLKRFPAVCSVENCNAPAGHRSGLCLAHVKQRANRRRYTPSWDYSNA